MSVSYIPRLPSRLSTTGMNTRLNSSTFAQSPSKLALLSHHKLRQESSAEEPDLRRCLGHNAVLSRTMTAARRDVSHHRKSSSRFSEDNAVDGYISRKEDQGSVVRAQLAKAVRGWIRRRSMAADANGKTTITATTTTTNTPTTTTTNTPTTTTTKMPTTTTTKMPTTTTTKMPTTTTAKTPTTTTATTTTTPPDDNALARVAANNSRDTGNKWNTFSSLKRLVSSRKFWAQPVLMQATTG